MGQEYLDRKGAHFQDEALSHLLGQIPHILGIVRHVAKYDFDDLDGLDFDDPSEVLNEGADEIDPAVLLGPGLGGVGGGEDLIDILECLLVANALEQT